MPVIMAFAASGVIVVPALIYTALHPTNVTTTIKQIATHVQAPIKDIGHVSIVATRSTPTPAPSPSVAPTPSSTPASKAAKEKQVELAHLAHLKRAHQLALAAAARAKEYAATAGSGIASTASTSAQHSSFTTQSSSIDGQTAGTTPVTQPETSQATSSTKVAATEAPAVSGASDQPAPDATPVYAPEIVVEARFKHEVEPDYPDIAKAQNAQGTAIVFATVGPTGNVLSTRIDSSTGNKLLDDAALAAARQSSFEAPMINGKPATETYRLVYTFAL